MTTCKYHLAHHKLCGKETDGGKLCDHHLQVRCVSCHAQATRNCTYEGQTICGVALCDDCEHVQLEGVGNGQFYSHAGKGTIPKPEDFPHYAPESLKPKKK